MPENKTRTTVKIYGSEYAILSPLDEEYVKKIGYYVDKKMTELSSNDKRLSTALSAILTAMNIADELFRMEDENKALMEKYNKLKEDYDFLKTENDLMSAEIKELKKADNLKEQRIQQLLIENAKLETQVKNQKSQKDKGVR
ncbi:MAG: cell division protein ZapA [Clostridiaceae bacterium]|nr:cell division protein ZapA [Clostridiaceae bacterium]